MKVLHNFLGVLWAFSLVITLLITSVEAVTYWMPGYYEKEYRKHQVLDNVPMEMDDLLEVTDEMMAYLRGDRENLHVPTIVGGQEREFFNEREIAHMEDVRGLFLGALAIRQGCMLLMIMVILLFLLMRVKIGQVLPRMVCIGTTLFFAVSVLIAMVVSSDFSKYFVVFHKIFFNNDLWILDPRTDLLINIVPEPFFMDTALRIAAVFGCSVIAVFLLSALWAWRTKLLQKAGREKGK